MYQAVSAQAAAIHELLVDTLGTRSGSYRPLRPPTRSRSAEFSAVKMLDFAALPPEVNSGLMYSGPGSGPMLDHRRGLG